MGCMKSEHANQYFHIFFLFQEILRIGLGLSGFIFDVTYRCFDIALEHLL